MEAIATLATDFDNLDQITGNTPLYGVTSFSIPQKVKISAKLEWMQIGGSVKSRPAYRIIKDALLSGLLTRDKVLLDASSGNTAIAYAAIGAALGISVTICLPENAGQARKDLLNAHGAELILTSKFGGTDDAQIKAKELAAKYPERFYYADQYNNPSNWQAHYHGTGPEIYRQTSGAITHLVVGLGTTGSAMGTYKKLKELNPQIKLVTLQPDVALHNLEGWKHMETALVPGIYDPTMAHDNLLVDSNEALELIPQVARKEGLMISPSAAGNLLGALKVAQTLDQGHIVTLFPDSAEKYGSLLKTLDL